MRGPEVDMDNEPASDGETIRARNGEEDIMEMLRRSFTDTSAHCDPDGHSVISRMNSFNEAPFRDSLISEDHDKSQYSEGRTGLDSTKKEMKERRKRRKTLLLWWKESAAMLWSVALMVAIVAVLLVFDGKPLNSWNMPWHVKPNTFISILMTLCKLSMLLVVAECLGQLKWEYFEQRPHPLSHFQIFDNASRGPFGSILLLFSVHFAAIVASLGALITILALAMEPFTQQVLSFVSQNTVALASPSSSVWAATAYDYYTDYIDGLENTSYLERTVGNLDSFQMSAAILASLADTTSSIRFECQTGNCTWATFTSLGVCSRCRDVSDFLIKDCSEHSQLFGGDPNGPYCNYTTPFGTRLRVYRLDEDTPDTLFVSGSAFDTNKNMNASGDPPVLPTLGLLSSLRVPNNGFYSSTRDLNNGFPQPEAYDCSISFCSKTYEADRVVNGVLLELNPHEVTLELPFEPTRDYPKNAPQSVPPLLALAETPPYRKFGKCTRAYTMSINESEYTLNSTYTRWRLGSDGVTPTVWPALRLAAFSQGTAPPNRSCLSVDKDKVKYPDALWINYEDAEQIVRALDSIFTQTFTVYSGDNWLGQTLYSINDGNFSRTMDAVATGLTNVIRQGPNATRVAGDSISTEVVIHVNWPWLIFPAVLVLATLVFMLATYYFSFENNQVVWKTSSLAVLFHGLEGGNSGYLQDVRSLREMDERAKGITAFLREDDNGQLNLCRR